MTMPDDDAKRRASTPAAFAKPLAHGGDLDAARRRFPHASKPWIDLSTGVNPVSYPLPEIPGEVWSRLPLAGEERALRRAAAARYGAPDHEMIVAAPGSQAIIQALPYLIPGGRVAILSPAYAEHRAAWTRAGHDTEAVNDVEQVAADVLVVVNPNNPTGATFAARDLTALAKRLAELECLLVVDEAFMDVLTPGESLIPALPSNAIVLRSFGKTYGLAGLRLGFAVMNVELAARLREHLGPWAVPGPAIAVGRAALADEQWLETARARLARDATRLDDLLTAKGCMRVGGTPLFRLVTHPRAEALSDALGNRAILVRQFEKHPSWLRFGLPGSGDAWSRLEAALAAMVV